MALFSFAIVEVGTDRYILDLFGIHFNLNEKQVELIGFWYLAVVVLTSCVLSITTIFLYKNRKFQLTLCKLNLLLYLGVILTVFYSANKALTSIIDLGMEAELHYKVGVVLPIVSVILVLLASRAIKKDDELVRSADRIR
jgi:hypothetical protein